ncbi:TetR/AcrR family transcriptional regulator [Nonomuraea sp. NPDC049655]|uniref:TetR/AcrR family transcriptional regulator n=1 Tax=Nonomuraea sp. NPDC049655 TaxID=3364355 RepID=UPI0037A00640
MPTRARERLLDAAEDLFYAEGIRAVGVERILSVSGVGRASFYRHFPSKDDLVVAVLRRRDERWRAWLAERVEALGGHPLDVFDALAERFARADFRGCAFINTMIETADPDSAAHRVAAEHKERVRAYVSGLIERDGRRADAAELAHLFVLLVDGAIVTAVRERSTHPAQRARAAAAALLTTARTTAGTTAGAETSGSAT